MTNFHITSAPVWSGFGFSMALVLGALLSFPNLAHAVTYRVTLVLCEGDRTIDVADDKYILDAAEEAGIDLPYSSRAGVSLTEISRLLSGQVDQSDQSLLTTEQVAMGFVLYDVAYPSSDVRLLICGARAQFDQLTQPPVCP